jgi:hypothetical protein
MIFFVSLISLSVCVFVGRERSVSCRLQSGCRVHLDEFPPELCRAKRLTAPPGLFSLAEEDMYEEERRTPPDSPITHKACLAMLKKVCPDSPLPAQCKEYHDVQIALQRKNSNKSDHAIAFQGMAPGEAASAMAARERGELSHAQIQRRLTTTGKKRLW